MKKSFLALAMSLVAASGAHAAWDAGATSVNDGNGEALLVIWDATTGNSYAQDLGVRFEDLKVDGTNATINLDSAALQTAFGGSYTNASWTIIDYSRKTRETGVSGLAGNRYTQYGAVVSGNVNSVPAANTPASDAALNGFLAGLQPQLQTVNTSLAFADTANEAINQVSVGLANDSKYVGSLLGEWSASTFGYATGTSVSDNQLNLFYYGFNNDANIVNLSATSNYRVLSNVGTATLNLAGNSLTFAPTVPVPAAVWLLGSALAGLGGVARSRRQRA